MFTIIIIFVRYFHHVGTKVCCAATGMICDPLPHVILRVHDSGEPVFLVRRTDDAIVNNFFSTDRRRGRRDDDNDGRSRIYAAHHRGTPCVAAASRVH